MKLLSQRLLAELYHVVDSTEEDQSPDEARYSTETAWLLSVSSVSVVLEPMTILLVRSTSSALKAKFTSDGRLLLTVITSP